MASPKRLSRFSPLNRLIARRGPWTVYRTDDDILVLEHDYRGVVMTDEGFEMDELEHAAEVVHGNVVVAGLGLGLVVDEMARNPMVDEITVVEVCRNIIDLVGWKYIGDPMLTIVEGDAYEFPHRHVFEKLDWVYLDIWDDDSGATYPERQDLRAQWEPYCSNVLVWAEDRSKKNWDLSCQH